MRFALALAIVLTTLLWAAPAAAVHRDTPTDEVKAVVTSPDVGATSSVELLEDLRGLDGEQIAYAGEVVGDVMIRGEMAWINIHDGDNALGVWLPAKEAGKVGAGGDYLRRGDIVTVTGRFARSCREHQGEVDIHATGLTVLATSQPLDHPIDGGRAAVALLLVVLATLLYGFNRPHLVRRLAEALSRTRPGV